MMEHEMEQQQQAGGGLARVTVARDLVEHVFRERSGVRAIRVTGGVPPSARLRFVKWDGVTLQFFFKHSSFPMGITDMVPLVSERREHGTVYVSVETMGVVGDGEWRRGLVEELRCRERVGLLRRLRRVLCVRPRREERSR